MRSPRPVALVVACLALGVAACGDDAATGTPSNRPTVVVTTSILGDVVGELVGDAAEVVTVMPVGANPHDFQPSAREVARMREADALVVSGAGFEEGLLDAIDGAADDGVPVHEAIEAVDTLTLGELDHGDDDDAEAEDDAKDGGVDPHFFTDPARMATAADAIGSFLRNAVPSLDTADVEASIDAYVAELRDLDQDVATTLEAVPERRRVMITNHAVFGYFADRYGFEIVGAVIPGGSTDGASAGELAVLAETIRAEEVPAIFADTSSPTDLAETLAAEVGDVEVVELFSESLGEPGSGGHSYLDMMRTNAQRIADALSD